MDESHPSQIIPKTFRLRSLKLSLQVHSSTFFVAHSCRKMPTWKRAGTSSGFLVVQGGVVMGNWRGRCFCTQLGSLYLDSQFEKALKTQPYVCLIRWLPHLRSWQENDLCDFIFPWGKWSSKGHWKQEKWIKADGHPFLKLLLSSKYLVLCIVLYKVSDSKLAFITLGTEIKQPVIKAALWKRACSVN